MTETSQSDPGLQEPLILERLSDLEDQVEYLAHFPDIRAHAVVNPLGCEVGIVDDLYVNPRNRRVEMAAITFTEAGGYGGKQVLVPIDELELTDDNVQIMSHEERVRQAPELDGGPMYEAYYEYWSAQPQEEEEARPADFMRPAGRLELEGEEDEELEEEPISR